MLWHKNPVPPREYVVQCRVTFQRNPFYPFRLSPEEREYLWSRRDYLSQLPEALSKVLAGAPSWEWSMLRYIYPLVDEWEPLPPLMALHLLLPR